MNLSNVNTAPVADAGRLPVGAPAGAGSQAGSPARTAAASAAAAFDAVEKPASDAVAQDRHPGLDRAASGPRPPTCYYWLVPADKAAPASGDAYKGAELRGTRAYERLVTTLATPRSGHPPPTPADKRRAGAIVDDMTFKPRSILIAPCHEGHEDADRAVRVGPSASGRSRRAIPERDAALHARDGAPDAPPAPRPVKNPAGSEVTICPAPSAWRQFISFIAPLLGAFTDLATGGTGTHQAIHPDRAAANAADPCDERAGAQDTADDGVEAYHSHLYASTLSGNR
jgi:hypothetical protein